MPKVFFADPSRHAPQIRVVFWEYLEWGSESIFLAYHVSVEIEPYEGSEIPSEYQKYWGFMER